MYYICSIFWNYYIRNVTHWLMKKKINQNGDMKRMRNINKDNKELRKYTCPYCGEGFERWVGKCENYDETGAGSCVSSQVKCRGCGNFLPTWDY